MDPYSNSASYQHVDPESNNLEPQSLDQQSGAIPPCVPTAEGHASIEQEATPANGNDKDNQSGTKKKRQFTSECWTHFQKVTDPPNNEDGKVVAAICLVCGKVLKYKTETGTGSLKKHKRIHIQKGESVPEEHMPQMVQTQIKEGGFFKFDPDKARRSVIKFCVKKEYPLSLAADPCFEDMIKEAFQPYFKKSYHKQTRDELMNQFWTKRAQLFDEFKEAKYMVSITSDIWTTGKKGQPYCSVTAHWISDDDAMGSWIINKRILAFRVLRFPHDGQAIFEHILEVLEEYNIRDKIFAVALDNASNNVSAIRILSNSLCPMLGGAFFHTKCACHILNLIVKDGLQVKEVDALLEKYYKALKFVDSSTKKKQYFADLCSRMGILSVKIPWDVETRWNSTYLLLKKTLHLRPAIDHALSSSPTGQQYRLNQSEWISLEALVPFLENFYTATVRLSATYTPTTSALIEDLVAISDWLKVSQTSRSLAMIQKNFGSEVDEDQLDNFVKNLFESVYKIYEERYSQARSAQQQGRRGEGSSSMSHPSNLSGRSRGSVSRLLTILNKCSDTPIQQQSNTEIQIYISSDYATVKADDENFDILRFWNQVKGVLPILSSMARDIFAAPVSTVASESCFSAANRVLTDKRTRLGPETFEALVLLKDWYDAERRLQDKSWMHTVPELGESICAKTSGSSQHNQNEGSQDAMQVNEQQEQQFGFNPYQCNYEDYGYQLGDYESWN
ncbi:hypothetical protein LUZ61_018472 [Rhynchospora tenuis]|uniref:BED-type domain-containing protein n=1 Tax=Rhynchospora tenuis TaxID=198213 RepID=A0AAD5Z9F3_9POAL|nr:hypothetical protein LUZ61_018472 [Rhynchospora tenuis]